MQGDMALPDQSRELPPGETAENIAEIEPFSPPSGPLAAIAPGILPGGATPRELGGGLEDVAAPTAASSSPMLPPIGSDRHRAPSPRGAGRTAHRWLWRPVDGGVASLTPAVQRALARRGAEGDQCLVRWPLPLTLLVAFILLACGGETAMVIRNSGSGCTSGCAITSTYGSSGKTSTGTHAATGGGGYWAVDILFTSTTHNDCDPCKFAPISRIAGRGNACTNSPITLHFGAGGSAWGQCAVSRAPVGTHDFGGPAYDSISGAYIGTMDNPGSSYWSGNRQVSQGGCDGAARQVTNDSQRDNCRPSGLNFAAPHWQGGVGADSTPSSAYHDMWWLSFNTVDAQNAAANPALSRGILSDWAQKPGAASLGTNVHGANSNGPTTMALL